MAKRLLLSAFVALLLGAGLAACTNPVSHNLLPRLTQNVGTPSVPSPVTAQDDTPPPTDDGGGTLPGH
jgi:hypothetical protein